ncbi:hypothetical protein V2E29_23660 [Streptomyces diastatochromogenes]|uniref:TlpA family protein disulfide reductase n=1 Tax=Streptomyces diastatochromogenes TaxID=42236 RepID=UPI002F2612A2
MTEALVASALLISFAALLLALAVARRVTVVLKHVQKKYDLKQKYVIAPGSILPVSDLIGDDGRNLRDGKTGLFVVAYLSSECSGCRAQAAELMKGAIRVPGPRLISVVLGEGEGAESFAEEVASFSEVVTVGYGSRLVGDVGVSVWPTFMLCDQSGRILSSTGRVDELEFREFSESFESAARR